MDRKGDKEAADAAACDAIRGMFDLMDMSGEVVIGEGIKDNAPGLFKGERVGTWKAGSPRFDIALDPVDGTTNMAKGMPNTISCIAAAMPDGGEEAALQDIPAFYMKKLAYPPKVCRAWVADPSLPISVDAPLSEVIRITAQILGKTLRDVVVMILRSAAQSAIYRRGSPRRSVVAHDLRRGHCRSTGAGAQQLFARRTSRAATKSCSPQPASATVHSCAASRYTAPLLSHTRC